MSHLTPALLRTARRWVGPLTMVSLLPATIAVGLPIAADLHGNTMIVVTGGSMAPRLHAGDHALVKDVPDTGLRPGQVITYRAGGSGIVTTHRVIDVITRDEGLFVQTQGDANPHPDPNLTSVDAVFAVLDEEWARAGEPVAFAQSRNGRLMLLAPVLVLLSLWKLLGHRLPRIEVTGPRPLAAPRQPLIPIPRRAAHVRA